MIAFKYFKIINPNRSDFFCGFTIKKFSAIKGSFFFSAKAHQLAQCTKFKKVLVSSIIIITDSIITNMMLKKHHNLHTYLK